MHTTETSSYKPPPNGLDPKAVQIFQAAFQEYVNASRSRPFVNWKPSGDTLEKILSDGKYSVRLTRTPSEDRGMNMFVVKCRLSRPRIRDGDLLQCETVAFETDLSIMIMYTERIFGVVAQAFDTAKIHNMDAVKQFLEM